MISESPIQTCLYKANKSWLCSPIAALLIVWLASVLLLIIGQFAGVGTGLYVWPMGEDRVWLHLMQNNHGTHLARAFWLINDRNPLSPWWYAAVSGLVTHWDNGIYLVRKLVDPALALATFYCLYNLSKGKQFLLAISAATLVLFWNFSLFYEQPLWNFSFALALCLGAVGCYSKYVQDNRQSGTLLALSLTMYLLGIQTYTMHCGAVVAVFAIGVLQDPAPSILVRLRKVIVDSLFFAVILLTFCLSWVTTTRESSSYYSLNLHLFDKQVLQSVKSLIWQQEYTTLINGLLSWNLLALSLSALSFTLVFIWWFGLLLKRQQAGKSLTTDASGFDLSFLELICSLLMAISLPTIILESTSAIWYPGSRAPMIGQVFSPILFLSTLYFLCQGIFKTTTAQWQKTYKILAAVLCAVAVLTSVEYNRKLVKQTAMERQLMTGLQARMRLNPQLKYFFVRFDNVIWNERCSLHDLYIQTWFKRNDLHLKVIQDYPGPQDCGFSPTSFTKAGVTNAAIELANASAPRGDAAFLSFDGKTLHLLELPKHNDQRSQLPDVRF